MNMLDDIKRLTSIVVSVPEDLHLGKLTVILEQRAAAEKAALEREAAAVRNAVTPELQAAYDELKSKLEPMLQHIPGLSALVKAHTAAEGIVAKVEGVAETALHAVEAAIAPVAPAPKPDSDAIPTAPVL